jgi:hypothetical protein
MEKIPLNEEHNVVASRETLECAEKLCTFNRVMSSIFFSFLYIGLILFPWISEIIVVTQISVEHQVIVVLVCGVVQTLIAIYGSIRCGMIVYHCCAKDCDDDYHCSANGRQLVKSFWCGRCTDLSGISSGGYVVYSLPQWVITNAIISWVLATNHPLPVYVHLMVYMPVIAYIVGLFVGYAIKKEVENMNYNQV